MRAWMLVSTLSLTLAAQQIVLVNAPIARVRLHPDEAWVTRTAKTLLPAAGIEKGMESLRDPKPKLSAVWIENQSRWAVLNKHVVSGLEITCQGLKVKVSPGKCEVEGKPVTVSSGTSLPVAPVPDVAVQDEAVKLKSEVPKGWAHGTRLKGVQPRPGGTPLPGCLTPHSVVVKSAPRQGGTVFKEGED